MQKLNLYDKYHFLRKEYPYFIYEQYLININDDRIHIQFTFNISNKFIFKPEITIPIKSFFKKDNIRYENIQNCAFQIGLIELISYWKTTCSPLLIIKPHVLNQEQQRWWRKTYFHGLGEFFYTNGIPATIESFINFEIHSSHTLNKSVTQCNDTVIVPVGGGKDSAVTLELVKSLNYPIIPLAINPRQAILDTVSMAGFEVDSMFEIHRTLDPLLLQMNVEGFLNGHTPFSAMLAFNTVLSSLLTGARHIALSNESSANESTVSNSNINHQYSKSFEFEQDFRAYIEKYVSDEVNYFSFLRPLSELQIASIFACYPKFHSVFKSCNAGSKTDSWCCNCSKCLFAYIILSPFISQKEMISIFGQNLFDNKKMLLYFDQLCGIEKIKPFECVGTIDEVNVALCQIIEQMKGKTLPFLLDHYCQSKNFVQFRLYDFTNHLNHLEEENFLPASFMNVLKKIQNAREN